MPKSFNPSVTLPDGQVVEVPGCIWVLAFALGGQDWAIDQLGDAMRQYTKMVQYEPEPETEFLPQDMLPDLDDVSTSSPEFCEGCPSYNGGGKDGDDFRCSQYRGVFGKQSEFSYRNYLLPESCLRRGKVIVCNDVPKKYAERRKHMEDMLRQLGYGPSPCVASKENAGGIIHRIAALTSEIKLVVFRQDYHIVVMCRFNK